MAYREEHQFIALEFGSEPDVHDLWWWGGNSRWSSPELPASRFLSATTEYLFAKTNHKLERVAVKDIRYVESLREYAAVHIGEKRYVVSQTMKMIEAGLPADQFIRVHRTYIVAIAHIKEIYGNTIVMGEKEIPIGGSYKKEFFERVKLL